MQEELIKRSDVENMFEELNPREFTTDTDRAYCAALENAQEELKNIKTQGYL